MNPIICTDFYKVEHYRQYPEGTTLVYSNLTARKSRMLNVNEVVFFGLQHFIKKYLIGKFKKEFFDRPWEEVEEEYKYAISTNTSHIKALHQLGYLPLEIKALPEGTLVPIGVPMLTIKNTLPEFYWLTNYLETLLSCIIWQPITSATIAYQYKKLLTQFAKETGGDVNFVQWQGHDFSMRGMQGLESAILSGMGHLTSFTGTDTIPAIYALKNSYNAEGLIGASVPATEHSVMCSGSKEGEIETFKRLLNLYPTGILSVVSDTWDLWKVIGVYLIQLKEQILAREGKLVIRPDSGDPVKILTGWTKDDIDEYYTAKGQPKILTTVEEKGVVEVLWDIFGGTYVTGNDGKQYKLLDSHIGTIYGDSITLDRAYQICKRLKEKGFATTNVVLGIGSYTYTFNTRDTFGMAVKSTYVEISRPGIKTHLDELGSVISEEDTVLVEAREIFKDPVTDDGTKKSKKGLLCVWSNNKETEPLKLEVQDQVTWQEEQSGFLQTVFKDGKLIRQTTLQEIRDRLKNVQ